MDVDRICRTHISTGDLTPTSELVSALDNGQVILSQIVRALGEFLTSTEDEVRQNGLTFLANVVRSMNPAKINRAATQTLTNFFTSKLDDFNALQPSLEALTVLSKLPTFDDEATTDVYKGMVENLDMKAYVQALRHKVYVLVDSLLANHRKALQSMGADFLNSYTRLVDGEKDPRNLMLLFAMDKVILLEFDIAEHAEDFFDITFCYFPISFRPPPNDPYGITADDLKLALRGCMSATPHFAKMAIPLFLEKFTTSTGQSMRDLMLSMAACFPVYGAAAVSERSAELWDGIKTEILYSSDTTVEAASLNALESLIRTMYPTSADVPSGLAQDIIKQCLAILDDPDKAQAVPAIKALAALIRGSPSAGPYTLSQALPQLFTQFNRPKLPSQRAPILSTISSLLAAARSVYAQPDSKRSHVEEKSLSNYRGPLMDVIREGLRTEGLKVPAAKASISLIEIPALLSREDVEDLVRSMNDALVNDDDVEVRSTVITGLTAISTSNAALIENSTLPLLFHNLPDQAPALSDSTARDKYRSILGSLSHLCISPSLFETLVIRVVTKLELLASHGASPDADVTMQDAKNKDVDYRECNVAYAWDLLNCLAGVIDQKINANHTDVAKYFDKIIPRLYGLLVAAAIPTIGNSQPLFRDRRLLSLAAKITETLMWQSSSERQEKQFADMYAGFESGDMRRIVHDASQVKGNSGSPLRSSASVPEQDLISIYSATMQGTKQDVALPCRSMEQFLTSKVHWTIHESSDDFQLRYGLDMITALVNKREKDLTELDDILETIWVKEVIDTVETFEKRRKGLLTYLHIVKALALLRSPLAYTAVDRVTEILKLSNFDPLLVHEAASSLSVLSDRKGKGRAHHLTSKLLYAQKLWNHVFPHLLEGDAEAKGRERLPYLVAFASLLPLIPASLCISDLKTILPLLIRSLYVHGSSQRLNAITALILVMEAGNPTTETDALLHDRSIELVDALLKNASMDTSGDMEASGAVRSTALRCLAMFPDVYRYDKLRSIKSQVVRDLGKTLDDPSRSVRREAVECRAKWYQYGNAV